ncbi:Uu.00g144220.m01.CDS01 [Anthostomella pinea]|uniref:Uu.00g144220.m01.CDS01 n=1 Tax=Anthostomella pinea TaxID=933095 RepID=A0AAI8VQW9_9PEZI|nr:Uu.00g144220.m01.CDS01 [Anthostomella pinea]
MYFRGLLDATYSFLLLLSAQAQVAAASDVADSHDVKQVAVIGADPTSPGAGAAGSSAAYHLQQYAAASGLAVNITIFEKTSHIGGRTLTVDVFAEPLEPVEVGASIFVDVNYILSNATRAFGLPVRESGTDEDGLLGVWDGVRFVYTQNTNSWGWWNLARLFWKYGSAPYYTHRLVQETVGTFLKLYEAPYFPFRSLTTRAYQLGLVKVTGLTGEQFLAENKLDGPFAHDIIQASTRVNYASNLQYIHGLGTMVAMAPEGAKAVVGGNWQIFSSMVAASKATVYLNSSVTSITTEPGSGASKYRIKTSSSSSSVDTTTSALGPETQHHVPFDSVILATPYQFANITHAPDLLPHPIDAIPYATLHVTLFATPFRLSAAFFGLEPGAEVPISVLTTLNPDETPKSGADGAGSAGFYSATLVKVVTNPRTTGTEYVYKIFSPKKVTAAFLSELLGVAVPETFTPPETDTAASAAPSANADDESSVVVDPVSWYHATVFHPYPQKFPRVTFQDPILADGMYYTSGIESFISTMETSALMGMNVARLILDHYLGVPSADGEETGLKVAEQQHSGQDVLAGQQEKTAEAYGSPAGESGEL